MSEHELIVKVRDLYPRISKIESECVDLLREHEWFIGPTGISGNSNLSVSIEYLRSAANILEKLGKAKGLL